MKRQSAVTLPNELLAELYISPDAKLRALAELERMGLIVVDRSRGRSLRVSLIGPPDDEDQGQAEDDEDSEDY